MDDQNKLKIEMDLTDFEKSKARLQSHLDEVEKKLQRVGKAGQDAMGKVNAATQRASAAVTTASGTIANRAASTASAGGVIATGGARARGGTSIATRASNTIGARIAGGSGARGIMGGAGAVLGSVGGVAGIAVGSAIGSYVGNELTAASSARQSAKVLEQESAERIRQMIVRGIDDATARASERIAKNLEAKFQIDPERMANAVLDAKMGDGGALAGILKDTGTDPGTVKTANAALGKLDSISAGASAKAEAEQKGRFGAAWDRLKSTPGGAAASAWGDLVNVPGEILKNMGNTGTNIMEWAADRNGGLAPEQQRTTLARLANDTPLTKPKRGRGDFTVTVMAPKSIPTVTRNMGGR